MSVTCPTCGDRGFVWIPCVRYRTAHWRRKPEEDFVVVAHREEFRYPCPEQCPRSKAWVRVRRRGGELDE